MQTDIRTDFFNALNELAGELDNRNKSETESFDKKLLVIDDRLKTLMAIGTNIKIEHNLRTLAAEMALSEAERKIEFIKDTMTLNILTRLSLTVDIVAKIINSELLQLKQTTPPSNAEIDKESINNLKKELGNLQKATMEMQPYVDMLRIAIEKQKKWQNGNR